MAIETANPDMYGPVMADDEAGGDLRPDDMGMDDYGVSGSNPIDTLTGYINQANIATELDQEVLDKIGAAVQEGYDIDKASRSDWEKQTKTAMDLAMQVAEEKSWPWPKAANVKYPLITTAAIQFSARAYPAIIKGSDVVKGEVTGPDDDGSKKERAMRVGRHMSYQLLNDMEDWDEETDRLLLQLAIVGSAFRKTYFDSAMGRNCADLVAAKHLVYNHAVPWRKLRRMTHELFFYKNDVVEKVRGGLWLEAELGLPDGEDSEDDDGSYEFLEQHCWYDLDGDGYKEPYIVTVRKETSKVVRIVARFDEDGIFLNEQGEIGRIEPVGYFTKYQFMPNPDGGSYDVGLGILLNPINESVNTVLNQLFDAGTRQNVGGGFIGSGLRMKGGSTKFAPGEYKPVDNKGGAIRDNIYNIEHPGPSPVLFQLLGMLIDAGKDISSVKDILTGDQQVNQTATTTLALIEQGQKVFSAIYKRVHRSLKDEFRKLYRLNKLYMQPEEYYRFQDKQEQILQEDYQGDDTDVCPVSDPNLVSDAQQLTQAEALMGLKDDPFINPMEVRKRYLMAIKVENPEALLKEPGADPQIQQLSEALENASSEVERLEAQLQSKDGEAQARLEEANNEAQLKAQQAQIDAQSASEQADRDAMIAMEQASIDAQAASEQAERDMLIANEKNAMEQETALKKAAMAEVTKIKIAAFAAQTKDATEPAQETEIPAPAEDSQALMVEAMLRISDAMAMMAQPKQAQLNIVKQADGSYSGVRTEI